MSSSLSYAQRPAEDSGGPSPCSILPCYWPPCDQCGSNCYTCSEIDSKCGYTCGDALEKLQSADCMEVCATFTPTPTATPTITPTATPTLTSTPSPTSTPRIQTATIDWTFISSRAAWRNCLYVQNLSVSNSRPVELGCNHSTTTSSKQIKALQAPHCNVLRLIYTSSADGQAPFTNVSTQNRPQSGYGSIFYSGVHGRLLYERIGATIKTGLDDDGNRQNSHIYRGFNDFISRFTADSTIRFTIENSGSDCP